MKLKIIIIIGSRIVIIIDVQRLPDPSLNILEDVQRLITIICIQAVWFQTGVACMQHYLEWNAPAVLSVQHPLPLLVPSACDSVEFEHDQTVKIHCHFHSSGWKIWAQFLLLLYLLQNCCKNWLIKVEIITMN